MSPAATSVDSLKLVMKSGACPDAHLQLLGIEGREAISQLFEFELLFTADEPIDDEMLAKMLLTPCAIALGDRNGDVVHGLLRDIWSIDTTQSRTPRYIATLVPTAWLLTQTKNSRVFQDVTVPDLVRSVLGSYRLEAPRDYRVAELDMGPKREFVVQYQETDWDFLQRWLEHEGRFYWFEHGDDIECLVVADSREECPDIVAPVKLGYRDRNNLPAGRTRSVWDFDARQRRIPARVVVTEYNYRNPAKRLIAKRAIDDDNGFGTLIHHHEHFKTEEEGVALAKVRAERVACDRRTFFGRSDCARFRVGHIFELDDHPHDQRNIRYLITSMTHRAGYPVRDERELDGDAELRPYTCNFTAIPADVAYRPQRRTPWPRIHGIVTGHIAADDDGDVADLDDMGRYKVRLTYDMTPATNSKVSRWIRMAQPHTGKGHGTHHPLRKGAEVLVAHIDGDPDRPIIVGAVPNALTVGPTTRANASQTVTRTASGIRLEMEDMQMGVE